MKLALSLISLALFGVLYSQWRGWPPAAPEAPQPPAVIEAQQNGDEAPSAADLLTPPPPKEDYASVMERPLFLPDRRPPPEEPEQEDEAEPEALTELDGMDLTAVVITPSTVSAWVVGPAIARHSACGSETISTAGPSRRLSRTGSSLSDRGRPIS